MFRKVEVMDIHNTESTNLLLSSSEIKFYLTYKDFMDNYPNHLKKWLELQSPYGKEKDFKEEYIQIYNPFFQDCGINGFDFEVFLGKSYNTMSGIYDRFFNVSLYHDFLINETDVLRINKDNPAQALTSEYKKLRDVEYKKRNDEIYYFSYEVRKVLNIFFTWNEKTQTITFDKVKYRNFTKSIGKIVTFLLSDELYTDNNPLSEWNAPKKETLPFEPLPLSEPTPHLLHKLTEQTAPIVIETEPQSNLDFSDDTSTKEKLILLDELGVIDFLKSKPPFNTSTNALATALSGVLGIKQSTLQSYLSPMFNPDNEQRNNPRNNHNLVEKAKIKLITIGYKK